MIKKDVERGHSTSVRAERILNVSIKIDVLTP